MKNDLRIALTGFMGVGKSSVARHIESITGCPRIDLDNLIESKQGRTIAEMIDDLGLDGYRRIETECLQKVIRRHGPRLLSLGGGTWTIVENRCLIREAGFTSVWLESSFEHCWYNIKKSHRDRPLARDKAAAKKLFDERQEIYCLADQHFLVRQGYNSYEIATQIVEQLS